jgi:arginyl-tRNA synthetase
MNLRAELENRLRAALAAAGAPDAPAMVAPAARAEFGDYQANGVMGAAKLLKTNPRKLAEKVVAQTAAGSVGDLSEIAEKVEVAGPGFINIRLKKQWLGARLSAASSDERLGVERPAKPQAVVVDYSAPNLAKEMHVGHLRSTIIGDALARTLGFIGHKVVRQNHVGDWGTQFGMLLCYYWECVVGPGSVEVPMLTFPAGMSFLQDMEVFYQRAKGRYDSDTGFAERARAIVVRLQQGDSEVRENWEYLLNESMNHCREVYRRLGVLLTDDDIRGESVYNDDLPSVVADLREAGLLTESRGAQCVFLDEFKGKDGNPLPLIVQKSDEGYLYATTDLAAIRYRCGTGPEKPDWAPADRILYVVDARQSLHFGQVFAVARKAGFAPDNVSLEHVSFGTMMGPDGRPFKTREGETVKLMDLLDEAERRAYELVVNKEQELPPEQRRNLDEDQLRHIGRVVGIGAVKYADLSQNRTSDYVFSWDKMLALDGNTAPYMQYAYARIRSIFRKGGLGEQSGRTESGLRQGSPSGGSLAVSEPAERALAVKLLQFPETVEAVADECLPNILCSYLYDLAGAFMGFYENCPVLQSQEPVRGSRLRLCDLAARTIKTGLGLLGIGVIEQM